MHPISSSKAAAAAERSCNSFCKPSWKLLKSTRSRVPHRPRSVHILTCYGLKLEPAAVGSLGEVSSPQPASVETGEGVASSADLAAQTPAKDDVQNLKSQLSDICSIVQNQQSVLIQQQAIICQLQDTIHLSSQHRPSYGADPWSARGLYDAEDQRNLGLFDARFHSTSWYVRTCAAIEPL
jgi:hypothetical protein